MVDNKGRSGGGMFISGETTAKKAVFEGNTAEV